ncbi:MAG: hypothetical protein JST68_14695 [Bacteroidetes bacterium]|nr:hypothetical protein [Bacteroidota bacterium]
MKCFYNVLILLLLSFAGYSNDRLTLFGRGMYPGDDSTYASLRSSGFGTVVLSSFYIRANGDVFSGDDNKMPIIHEGKYVGNKDWLKRVAVLKKAGKRIEILLEGRWFNQAPNTYDFILDWTVADSAGKSYPGVRTGTAPGSTLYGIAKVFRDEIGANALCIDDESVYNSASIVNIGQMLGKMGMHMSLCPYTRPVYWKEILNGSEKGLIDAIYLQCYDGGARNVPARWDSSLATTLPIDPIFLCRGSYDTCGASHNGKTPQEIKGEMDRFKKGYPGLSGGAIWQVADLKNYIRLNCAVKYPASGDARSLNQYLQELQQALSVSL